MTLILNGTDNSATTPAVQGGTAGTTTGIYYPTTNQVAIATNGTQAILVDASQNVTVAGTLTSTGYANLPNTFGFKNRIINGAMVIDQRNAGATVSSSGAFPVDRFIVIKDTSAGTFTAGQSSTVPSSGFTKSLLFTVGTAYTPAAGENNFLKYYIEGYNVADLSFGTAGASNITLSFWVRSSLTGTFGGALTNGGNDRTYVFSYTISAANTFEYKTISIPAYTSGTWNTTNSVGFEIRWGLGVGSTFLNTAGAWYSGNYISATGSTNVTSTAGATWYVTGVQLEKGSTATSFDYRSIGTEFFLCQRYFETNYGVGYAIGSANSYPNNQGVYFQGFNSTSGQKHVYDWFKVPKRAVPTATYYDWAGNSGKFSALDTGGTATNNQSIGYTPLNQNSIAVGSTSTNYGIAVFWTASAEL